MSKDHGAPAREPNRRGMLRMAGGGLTLAVLTAGATGCREDDSADDGGSASPGKPHPAREIRGREGPRAAVDEDGLGADIRGR